MEHNANDLQKRLPIYALLSRIRLSSSKHVLQKGEQVIKAIVNTYPQPNLTVEEARIRSDSSATPVALNWPDWNDDCRLQGSTRRDDPHSWQ